MSQIESLKRVDINEVPQMYGTSNENKRRVFYV
jgi:hypothetical protein